MDQLGVALMEGEAIDSVLDLRAGLRTADAHGKRVLVLTNRRLVHLRSNSRERSIAFASLQDIASVEVAHNRRGVGGYLWSIAAMFLAGVVWRTIESSPWAAAGAIGVALMGLYLFIERVTESSRSTVVFRIGATQMSCELAGAPPADVDTFTGRVFDLKGRRAPEQPAPEEAAEDDESPLLTGWQETDHG